MSCSISAAYFCRNISPSAYFCSIVLQAAKRCLATSTPVTKLESPRRSDIIQSLAPGAAQRCGYWRYRADKKRKERGGVGGEYVGGGGEKEK